MKNAFIIVGYILISACNPFAERCDVPRGPDLHRIIKLTKTKIARHESEIARSFQSSRALLKADCCKVYSRYTKPSITDIVSTAGGTDLLVDIQWTDKTHYPGLHQWLTFYDCKLNVLDDKSI